MQKQRNTKNYSNLTTWVHFCYFVIGALVGAFASLLRRLHLLPCRHWRRCGRRRLSLFVWGCPDLLILICHTLIRHVEKGEMLPDGNGLPQNCYHTQRHGWTLIAWHRMALTMFHVSLARYRRYASIGRYGGNE